MRCVPRLTWGWNRDAILACATGAATVFAAVAALLATWTCGRVAFTTGGRKRTRRRRGRRWRRSDGPSVVVQPL